MISGHVCWVWLGMVLWFGRAGARQDGFRKEHLNSVMVALDRALDFLKQEHRSLNLDAVIGTRIVDGQLSVLLDRLNTAGNPHVTNDVIKQIRKLQRKADSVSALATPYVNRTQPEYYARIGPLLVQGFWTLDYRSRDIDTKLITERLYKGESMHEKDSDDCLTELFGTSGKTTKKCQTSDHCWNLMTSQGFRGYSLSHEVFYLEIAKQVGCLKGYIQRVADVLTAGFCANMRQEAVDISSRDYPEDRRDLFMELQDGTCWTARVQAGGEYSCSPTAALCGMLGYREFFQASWLDQILSWQHPSRGCYGHPDEPHSGLKRVRREEKTLQDGCQCHRTAVAVGALGEYIRYIIEYMS